MDFGRLRRHAHLLGAAPRDRADIAVGDVVRGDDLAGRAGQIVHAGRHLEPQNPGRIDQPRVVIVEVKNLAVIDPLAFEHAACIMQPVAQHMQLGIAPRNQATVIPDEAVAVVEGDHVHERLPCTGAVGAGPLVANPAGPAARELYIEVDAQTVCKVAR